MAVLRTFYEEMKKRHDERYENDDTPSREVARKYREHIDDEDADFGLALISYRGGEDEFLLGKEYCFSDDAWDRATGAAVLSQLGWGDQTYRDESIEILIPMLDDPHIDVVSNAAYALGHRKAESAIPALLRIADHPEAQVRSGVVSGLSTLEDDRAIAGLIKLAGDDDHDVRDWAVFGLGSLIESDSPAIREALRNALGDPDHEVRGEGLVGLALRGDPAIVSDLISEWAGDTISKLSIEAAEVVKDPKLLCHLKEIAEDLELDDDPSFASVLADAIAACTSKASQAVD